MNKRVVAIVSAIILLALVCLPIVVHIPAATAQEPTEVIEARTANSKTYYLGENTYALNTSLGAIHYLDSGGLWQNIDPDYSQADTGNFTAQFTRLPYLVRMGDDCRRRIYPDRNDLSYWIEVAKPFPSMGTPTKVDGYWVWNFPNALIAVQIRPQAVKLGFRLKNNLAPTSITFPFSSQGITRNGNELLHNGEVVAYLQKPTAIDANGTERDCTVNFDAGQITISLNTTGLVFPIDVDPTFSVGASSDDCNVYGNDAVAPPWDTIFLTATYQRSGNTGDGLYRGSGFRFSNVTIPQGATIDSAYLTLICADAESGTTVNTNIYCEAADDAATFSDVDNYNARSRTSGVAWDSIGTWTLATSYNSPSIVTPVQAVIDRVGWASGNDLAVFWEDDDSSSGAYRAGASWDHVSYNTPALYVEYTSVTVPTVVTSAATNVEATTATLNGNVTATGGENPTVTVYWGDNDGGTTPANWDFNSVPTSPAQPQGVASFYKNVTSLSPGILYFFNAKGTNSGGTGWATTKNFTTSPAAPTNVVATDGDFTDKVVINWTKSTGATGYYILEGSNLLDTLGDVATYDDTAAPAPTITPGTASATDGSSTAYVTLSMSGESASNGTSRTYKVIAFNTNGNSTDSATDTGFRGVGALTYQWYRSAADSDADYSILGGATTDPYDDTTAPASTVTPGTASATDGASTSNVTLSLSGESANVGAGRYYLCELSATGAASQNSTSDRGYRAVGALTYQWYCSLADSDADYSSLGGATTDPYDDTTAPAPTITAGNASASDGTSAVHVTLDLSNQVANNGSGRYFQCEVSATGAVSENSTSDRGYRGTDTLTYQWQRSTADSDADYLDISGGTTDPYNDTGGVPAPDGRYYKCLVNMAGADSQNSTADRGYMITIVAPTVTSSNATSITGATALLHGNITDTGYENPDTIGFDWGLSTGNYTFSWNTTGNFTGTFTHTIDSLLPNTEYFWIAFAINTGGRGNSSELNFTTLEIPSAPTNFTATAVGTSSANLTWIMGVGASTTMIRMSEDGYPQNVTEGILVYSGNETYVVVGGLNLDTTAYYFSAWSENAYGYSIDHAEAKIGGDMQNILMFGLLFFMAGSFVGFYLWKREMWLGIAAGVAWMAVGIYAWFGYEAPTPEMTTMWFGLGWLFLAIGLALLVAPLSWNKTKDEIWEEAIDPDTGEPIMEEYKKGNKTGQTRSLTDLEIREKQQPEGKRKRNNPSQFSQNGRL
jgi:hypothetical protein